MGSTSLAKFSQAKADHAFTLNVPAPVAPGLVEAAFYAGGYEVIEPPAEMNSQPELQPPPFEPDARKAAALELLEKAKSSKADKQLGEIREILSLILDMLPG